MPVKCDPADWVSGPRRQPCVWAFTNRIRALLNDPDEPDWIEEFKRYRHLVDVSGRNYVSAGTDPNHLELYVGFPAERYVAYPRATLMAAVVPDGREWLTDEQRAAVREMAAGQDAYEPNRGRLFLEHDRVAPDLDWQPDHLLFPDLALWPGTRTPPPA